jgi:hypothetical protein
MQVQEVFHVYDRQQEVNNYQTFSIRKESE